MNFAALIPLVSLLCYAILLLVVARGHIAGKMGRLFGLYLFSMLIWSFCSFMMHLNTGIMTPLFWNRLLIPAATAMPIAFFAFVQEFLQKRRKSLLRFGLASYAIIQVANVLGYGVRNAYVANGRFHNEYGPFIALIGGSWVFFVGHSAFDLWREYRRAKDSLHRERIRYLLLVVLVIAIGALTNATVLQHYPVDIACNAIGAFLITYAILRHQLLDITLVVRKGLLYSVPTVIIGTGYFLMISLAARIVHDTSGPQFFLLSFAAALVTALVAEPLRNRVQLWIDSIFFRERYDSSLMLQRLSQSVASVLDINVLTSMILSEIHQTMHIANAALLLRQEKGSDFRLAAQQGLDATCKISIRADHPLVHWLLIHENALTKQDVEVIPQFRALWREERQDLMQLGAEIWIPLKVKGELVGILAVGPKLSGEPYSLDDRLTLTTLASQTAMAIDNARLYEAARQEVAERRRAEAQLRASEERYHSLFDDVPVGLYRTTPEGKILEANAALVQMLGFADQTSLLATDVNELCPNPRERQRELVEAERRGLVSDFEMQLRRHDGAIIWVRDSFRVVRDEAGRTLYYEGSLEDITERKQAQEELVRSHNAQTVINLLLRLSLEETPLDQVLERTLDAILATLSETFEPSGAIFLAEESGVLVMRIWRGLDRRMRERYARVTADNSPYGRFIGARHVQVITCSDDEGEPCFGDDGKGGHCGVPILSADKTIGLIALRLRPERQPNSQEIEFLSAVANALASIIIRKQSEEERKKMQAQLLQAQKMEAVGRLAGGVAHDFNNLLTAIISYSDFLLKNLPVDDPRRLDVEEIRKAGERAAALTGQLLAFSRRQLLQPRVLNLNDVVLDMGKLLQRLIGEDVRLVMTLDPSLDPVKADLGQIEQVIINLAINGRDAMPDGGKLTIRTENISLDGPTGAIGSRKGRFVCLSVEDTGTGMDEAVLQHLFEPFFTTKEAGKGTGLGLAVVYGIIAQHGGWVSVESQRERGSIFRTYLPAALVNLEEEGEEEIALEWLQGNQERVLLVEDEKSVCGALRRALVENGYTVWDAPGAAEAMQIYEQEKGQIDLLFSDVVLPGESGIQLAERLRARQPNLPILLSSGYTDRDASWAAIEEKGFRFLQKPYNITTLLRAIKETLEPSLWTAVGQRGGGPQ